MHCEIEPLTMIARIWSDGKGYGDPYEWCVTLCKQSHGVYEATATVTAPTPAQWRALYRACQKAGISEVIFRRADGRVRSVLIHELDEYGDPVERDFDCGQGCKLTNFLKGECNG